MEILNIIIWSCKLRLPLYGSLSLLLRVICLGLGHKLVVEHRVGPVQQEKYFLVALIAGQILFLRLLNLILQVLHFLLISLKIYSVVLFHSRNTGNLGCFRVYFMLVLL